MQSNGVVSRRFMIAAVAMFLALSVADLFLTRQLIESNSGEHHANQSELDCIHQQRRAGQLHCAAMPGRGLR